jgi:hypothetical protein
VLSKPYLPRVPGHMLYARIYTSLPTLHPTKRRLRHSSAVPARAEAHTRYHTIILAGLLSLGCAGGNDAVAPPKETAFPVSISGQGTGSGHIVIASDQGNMDCVGGPGISPCENSFPEGTELQLQAIPAEQSVFDRWDLDAQSCGSRATCTLNAVRELNVQATFTLAEAPPPPPLPGDPLALCNDGTYSYAAHHQGACSHHGGVRVWYR